MVDNPVCSDLKISLDSGATVWAHRFVLAAWNPELAILQDGTSCISAPGISKADLLDLLCSLYTFDQNALSTISHEAEFVLDWYVIVLSIHLRLHNANRNI